MRFLAVLVLLSFVALPSWAQVPFDPVAKAIRSEPLLLSPEYTMVSLTPNTTPAREVYTVHRSFASDGGFSWAWKSSRFEVRQVFRPDGTLISGSLSDALKRVTVAATSDAKRTVLRTVITEDGKVKSDKKVDLKAVIVLREELQHVIQQAWLYGIRDGLKFSTLSPDGERVGDFQVVFQRVTDPTSISDKYQYPDEFKAALGAKNSYLVADMTLQGVASLFFPHHFYLVYEVTPTGLGWRGYFGEDPKTPVFQYLKK